MRSRSLESRTARLLSVSSVFFKEEWDRMYAEMEEAYSRYMSNLALESQGMKTDVIQLPDKKYIWIADRFHLRDWRGYHSKNPSGIEASFYQSEGCQRVDLKIYPFEEEHNTQVNAFIRFNFPPKGRDEKYIHALVSADNSSGEGQGFFVFRPIEIVGTILGVSGRYKGRIKYQNIEYELNDMFLLTEESLRNPDGENVKKILLGGSAFGEKNAYPYNIQNYHELIIHEKKGSGEIILKRDADRNQSLRVTAYSHVTLENAFELFTSKIHNRG